MGNDCSSPSQGIFNLGEESSKYQIFVQNQRLFQRIQGTQVYRNPYRSIGAFTSINSRGEFCCASGILLSKNIMLTAAHSIYNAEDKQANHKFKFYQGAHGITKEYRLAETYRYNPLFQQSSSGNKLEYDYALVRLQENSNLPIKYNHFPKIFLTCELCFKQHSKKALIQIYGYPAKHKDNYEQIQEGGIRLYQFGFSAKQRINISQHKKYVLEYQINTLLGQSGCPVLMNGFIIGIHNAGDEIGKINKGRKITYDMLADMLRWNASLKGDPIIVEQDCKFCKQFMDSCMSNGEKQLKQKQIEVIKPEIEQLKNESGIESTLNLNQINITLQRQLRQAYFYKTSVRFLQLKKKLQIRQLQSQPVILTQGQEIYDKVYFCPYKASITMLIKKQEYSKEVGIYGIKKVYVFFNEGVFEQQQSVIILQERGKIELRKSISQIMKKVNKQRIRCNYIKMQGKDNIIQMVFPKPFRCRKYVHKECKDSLKKCNQSNHYSLQDYFDLDVKFKQNLGYINSDQRKYNACLCKKVQQKYKQDVQIQIESVSLFLSQGVFYDQLSCNYGSIQSICQLIQGVGLQIIKDVGNQYMKAYQLFAFRGYNLLLPQQQKICLDKMQKFSECIYQFKNLRSFCFYFRFPLLNWKGFHLLKDSLNGMSLQRIELIIDPQFEKKQQKGHWASEWVSQNIRRLTVRYERWDWD